MTARVISNGDQVPKDPSAIKNYPIDWDLDNLSAAAQIATSTWTITAIYPAREWVSTQAYAVGDQVVSLGQTYASILAHVNQLPPNGTYWSLVGAALTKDSESRLTGVEATALLTAMGIPRTVTGDNRFTQVRLAGGTLGQTYEIANKVVTNESPPQTKEKSFRIVIEQE